MHHLRELKIEPPAPAVLKRLIHSALRRCEDTFFKNIEEQLSVSAKQEIDALLNQNNQQTTSQNDSDSIYEEKMLFRDLKTGPRNISLKTVAAESSKLQRLQQITLPSNMLKGMPRKLLQRYKDRVITEPVREIRRHPPHIRYALLAIFVYVRSREITDALVDLLIQTVHKIGAKAEKTVTKKFIEEIKRVSGKDDILFQMASAASEHPDGVVKDVIFPVVSEETLQDIIREYKYNGPAYKLKVNTFMRASYSHHYRRTLPLFVKVLTFRSNNKDYQPIIKAVEVLKRYIESNLRYYPAHEEIPTEKIVPAAWQELVYHKDTKGRKRINRIAYELCVFGALREKLRCKEVWVIGADRYRNPDDDLPNDFDHKRALYYQELNQPTEATVFISKLQQTMETALTALDEGLPKNSDVEILRKNKGWITLSSPKPQAEPLHLPSVKVAIIQRWPSVSLLDILKEADLRVNFTQYFKSVAQREIINQATLQKRLLLVLYAIGTNAGLTRIIAGDHGEKYDDLLYVKRRFVRKESLRQAIANLVNAILAIRLPHIWGEATTACASDSKHFGTWDQNLLTEWHVRYGGRGVMIYWHVDKKASCIYSQLKTCSSSEAAAIIEGVMRHCTDMEVDRQYVDTHGQSYVAFAFCYLLGFRLLPRFKSIHSKKLYRPTAGHPDAYPNLQLVLTRPINWKLIRQQYDEMIKFATAIRWGTADAEAILRRFTRSNRQHPTYQALLELGKAVRTIFLCDYLRLKELRQEIQEGLNVIELWNGVNEFIFFGKGGDFATNRKENQELAMLSLHLLQNCLVYINTLMIQEVLKAPKLLNCLTKEDFRGLTPLIFQHINPYGTFNLDINFRLPIEQEVA